MNVTHGSEDQTRQGTLGECKRSAWCFFRVTQLGEAEIQNLCMSVFGEKNIFRLKVAMDHAFFVSGSKGDGKLGGDFDKFANRNWPRAKALTEAFAFQQFRCEKGNAVVFADEVDGENIGMRGSRRGLSLLAEPERVP